MKRYLHRVLGLHETLGAAEVARSRLVRLGLQASQLTMLQPGVDGRNREINADSDDVLYEMLGVGALVGARRRKADVADLARLSLASGQIVLVAHADTEEQTTSAQLILGPSISQSAIGKEQQ